MRIGEYQFMADIVTKFFNSLRIEGWFYHSTDSLASVSVVNDTVLSSVSGVGQEHCGVSAALGPRRGFFLQVLRPDAQFNDAARLEFVTRTGWREQVSLVEFCADRIAQYPTKAIYRQFIDRVNALPKARVLDIGGRDRSGLDRSAEFTTAECVVLDIHPGANVDVVGDAHALSRYFEAGAFDALMSISVFEHIMMPWAVVPQMNHVLKPGGMALIITHQTLGMHDLPWDFWRFSDTAWDALFNRHTGFEIVARGLDYPQFILPFIFRPDKEDAEKAAGFESSAVVVRKIGACRLAWDLVPSDITQTMYPTGTDA